MCFPEEIRKLSLPFLLKKKYLIKSYGDEPGLETNFGNVKKKKKKKILFLVDS